MKTAPELFRCRFLSFLTRCSFQLYGKSAAFAGLAADIDPAADDVNYTLDERKPQAVALGGM